MVTHEQEEKYVQGLVKKIGAGYPLKDLGVDKRIRLLWFLKEQHGKEWIGFL
jgi:hypothetical protein